MICHGIREVQSRLGAGIREWCCVECLTEFAAIEFDEEGRGVLPEHEVRTDHQEIADTILEELRNPIPAILINMPRYKIKPRPVSEWCETVKKRKRPIEED